MANITILTVVPWTMRSGKPRLESTFIIHEEARVGAYMRNYHHMDKQGHVHVIIVSKMERLKIGETSACLKPLF